MVRNSFLVSKVDLKKMITSLGVNEAGTEEMLAKLDKMHRHVDVVAFIGMLEKLGVHGKDITNVLRRIGIGDTDITQAFNVLDEERIEETFGKVSRITLVD
ncbi:MAG: hypothetical protein M1321_00910 [Candidatus Marsarchaeota archaeon]|jgi:hypothetical protein|nr:hypothetical protein [Candidatus Marsarchaeota archaeon]